MPTELDYDRELREIDEAHEKEKKKYRQKLPGYLNEEEFSRLMDVVKKPHHRLAFNLAFNSGLRVSEIVNLKPEDIDFEGKKIFIKNAKGGKDRVVPLPKGFPEKYLKIIPIKCGVRGLEIAIKRAIVRAKITRPGIHFHSLRHSFAVLAMEKGIPLNQIQMLLGHSNIATTSIYLKINPQDALKNYEKLW